MGRGGSACERRANVATVSPSVPELESPEPPPTLNSGFVCKWEGQKPGLSGTGHHELQILSHISRYIHPCDELAFGCIAAHFSETTPVSKGM